MNKSVFAASCLLILTVLVVHTLASATVRSSSFDHTWHTIDNGGDVVSGGAFELRGTIGQHDAGTVITGGSYDVAGGFWMGGPIPSCHSDIAGNGGSGPDGLINLFDLLLLLDNWGTSGPGASISDQGGGVAVVDLFDLLGMLDAWGACE